MKMKKIFNTLASASLVLSAVATTALSTSVQAEERETLVISAAGHYDYLVENIEDFENEYNVDVELWDKDMFEVLDGIQLDGPAGTGADVMIAPYDRIGSMGIAGHIRPVTISEEEGVYDETDVRQVTAQDTVFGAPAVIETLVMYYNRDLIETAPTTFEEIEKLAQDEAYNFESEEGRNVGFLANWTNFYYTYGLLSGYGGYVFGNDGTDSSDIGLNNDGAIEAIKYATSWYENTWPQGMLDISTVDNLITESFLNGDTAVIIEGPWKANDFNEAGLNYGVAKIATLPNGEEYQAFGGGKGWTISAFTEKEELAQKFLDWVTSEEQQTKMYERLGEIPANHLSRAKAAEGDNELTQAVIAAYENAVPMPNIPEMGEVWVGAEALMYDATSGNKSAEDSANDAVQLIKDSIEQKGY